MVVSGVSRAHNQVRSFRYSFGKPKCAAHFTGIIVLLILRGSSRKHVRNMAKDSCSNDLQRRCSHLMGWDGGCPPYSKVRVVRWCVGAYSGRTSKVSLVQTALLMNPIVCPGTNSFTHESNHLSWYKPLYSRALNGSGAINLWSWAGH